MKTLRSLIPALLAATVILIGSSCNNTAPPPAKEETSGIDLTKARPEIEAVDRQFEQDFKNQDSLALANHYASDGMLASVRGRDNIVTAWGRMITNAVASGTPEVIYTTTSMMSDDEYVVELGTFKLVDSSDTPKVEGKYVVVWKQEGGEWKIYRDMGL